MYYDREKKVEVPRDGVYRSAGPVGKKLDPLLVRLILLDPRSTTVVGKDLGISHQAVSAVRCGKYYPYLWPDLPRNSDLAPTRVVTKGTNPCKGCTYWSNGDCDMGIPEAGTNDARDCNYFISAD